VSPAAFGITGRKVVAVVREAGAITGGNKAQGGQITAEPVIAQLEKLAEAKWVSGIVLRIDSPGVCMRTYKDVAGSDKVHVSVLVSVSSILYMGGRVDPGALARSRQLCLLLFTIITQYHPFNGARLLCDRTHEGAG
jgi:hypothetical protein